MIIVLIDGSGNDPRAQSAIAYLEHLLRFQKASASNLGPTTDYPDESSSLTQLLHPKAVIQP
jgi:hypothetical protein